MDTKKRRRALSLQKGKKTMKKMFSILCAVILGLSFVSYDYGMGKRSLAHIASRYHFRNVLTREFLEEQPLRLTLGFCGKYLFSKAAFEVFKSDIVSSISSDALSAMLRAVMLVRKSNENASVRTTFKYDRNDILLAPLKAVVREAIAWGITSIPSVQRFEREHTYSSFVLYTVLRNLIDIGIETLDCHVRGKKRAFVPVMPNPAWLRS